MLQHLIKLGIIKNEYLEYFKQHGGGNYEALYLESHPECRDTYNAYNKELDDICKKWDEQEKVWDELNEKVKPVHLNPKEFFQCTECGEVKPRSEYEDFVMAADYCKECAKIPEVAKLITESHKRGFYD